MRLMLLIGLTLAAAGGGVAFARSGGGHHGTGHASHSAAPAGHYHHGGTTAHSAASRLPVTRGAHQYCKSSGRYVVDARDCPAPAVQPPEAAVDTIHYNDR